MPRPTIDVNGPEYQNTLRARAMFKRHGAAYKDMMWAEDTLARLEKTPRHAYQDTDHDDFLKVKAILAKAEAETAENHTTPKYIWRTRGDGKVRSAHARNDGKIFSWDNPPATGHPGVAFGCRCWAEAYREQDAPTQEFRNQSIISFDPDSSAPWSALDFYKYYKDEERMKLGAPRALNVLTLSQVGHMQNVLSYTSDYNQPEGGNIYNRFTRDIFRKARQHGAGSFPIRFQGNYNLMSVSVVFRTSTIDGLAGVIVTDKGDFLSIDANIGYSFYDRYTDPYDILDHSGDITDEIYDDGIPFDIMASWNARLSAAIRKDSAESLYPDNEFGDKDEKNY